MIGRRSRASSVLEAEGTWKVPKAGGSYRRSERRSEPKSAWNGSEAVALTTRMTQAAQKVAKMVKRARHGPSLEARRWN